MRGYAVMARFRPHTRVVTVMKRDPLLISAAVAYAAADVYGSTVSARHGLAGRPFRITVPLSVRSGLLAGWGAGVAAPWPMPVAALVAAERTQQPQQEIAAARVCVGLGLLCIAGTFMEPLAYRPRSWTPPIRRAIAANLLTSAALVAAGLRHVPRRQDG